MKHLLPHWSDDGLYIDLISRSSGNCPSFSFCFLCFPLSFLLSYFSSSHSFLSSTQLCESHWTADFGSSGFFSVNICQDVSLHHMSVSMSGHIGGQNYYLRWTWPKWMVLYRLWKFSHKREHPKSAPHYFSLPLLVGYSHVKAFQWKKTGSEICIWTYLYEVGTSIDLACTELREGSQEKKKQHHWFWVLRYFFWAVPLEGRHCGPAFRISDEWFAFWKSKAWGYVGLNCLGLRCWSIDAILLATEKCGIYCIYIYIISHMWEVVHVHRNVQKMYPSYLGSIVPIASVVSTVNLFGSRRHILYWPLLDLTRPISRTRCALLIGPAGAAEGNKVRNTGGGRD